jgi:hypothetical protein
MTSTVPPTPPAGGPQGPQGPLSTDINRGQQPVPMPMGDEWNAPLQGGVAREAQKGNPLQQQFEAQEYALEQESYQRFRQMMADPSLTNEERLRLASNAVSAAAAREAKRFNQHLRARYAAAPLLQEQAQQIRQMRAEDSYAVIQQSMEDMIPFLGDPEQMKRAEAVVEDWGRRFGDDLPEPWLELQSQLRGLRQTSQMIQEDEDSLLQRMPGLAQLNESTVGNITEEFLSALSGRQLGQTGSQADKAFTDLAKAIQIQAGKRYRESPNPVGMPGMGGMTRMFADLHNRDVGDEASIEQGDYENILKMRLAGRFQKELEKIGIDKETAAYTISRNMAGLAGDVGSFIGGSQLAKGLGWVASKGAGKIAGKVTETAARGTFEGLLGANENLDASVERAYEFDIPEAAVRYGVDAKDLQETFKEGVQMQNGLVTGLLGAFAPYASDLLARPSRKVFAKSPAGQRIGTMFGVGATMETGAAITEMLTDVGIDAGVVEKMSPQLAKAKRMGLLASSPTTQAVYSAGEGLMALANAETPMAKAQALSKFVGGLEDVAKSVASRGAMFAVLGALPAVGNAISKHMANTDLEADIVRQQWDSKVAEVAQAARAELTKRTPDGVDPKVWEATVEQLIETNVRAAEDVSRLTDSDMAERAYKQALSDPEIRDSRDAARIRQFEPGAKDQPTTLDALEAQQTARRDKAAAKGDIAEERIAGDLVQAARLQRLAQNAEPARRQEILDEIEGIRARLAGEEPRTRAQRLAAEAEEALTIGDPDRVQEAEAALQELVGYKEARSSARALEDQWTVDWPRAESPEQKEALVRQFVAPGDMLDGNRVLSITERGVEVERQYGVRDEIPFGEIPGDATFVRPSIKAQKAAEGRAQVDVAQARERAQQREESESGSIISDLLTPRGLTGPAKQVYDISRSAVTTVVRRVSETTDFYPDLRARADAIPIGRMLPANPDTPTIQRYAKNLQARAHRLMNPLLPSSLTAGRLAAEGEVVLPRQGVFQRDLENLINGQEGILRGLGTHHKSTPEQRKQRQAISEAMVRGVEKYNETGDLQQAKTAARDALRNSSDLITKLEQTEELYDVVARMLDEANPSLARARGEAAISRAAMARISEETSMIESRLARWRSIDKKNKLERDRAGAKALEDLAKLGHEFATPGHAARRVGDLKRAHHQYRLRMERAEKSVKALTLTGRYYTNFILPEKLRESPTAELLTYFNAANQARGESGSLGIGTQTASFLRKRGEDLPLYTKGFASDDISEQLTVYAKEAPAAWSRMEYAKNIEGAVFGRRRIPDVTTREHLKPHVFVEMLRPDGRVITGRSFGMKWMTEDGRVSQVKPEGKAEAGVLVYTGDRWSLDEGKVEGLTKDQIAEGQWLWVDPGEAGLQMSLWKGGVYERLHDVLIDATKKAKELATKADMFSREGADLESHKAREKGQQWTQYAGKVREYATKELNAFAEVMARFGARVDEIADSKQYEELTRGPGGGVTYSATEKFLGRARKLATSYLINNQLMERLSSTALRSTMYTIPVGGNLNRLSVTGKMLSAHAMGPGTWRRQTRMMDALRVGPKHGDKRPALQRLANDVAGLDGDMAAWQKTLDRGTRKTATADERQAAQDVAKVLSEVIPVLNGDTAFGRYGDDRLADEAYALPRQSGTLYRSIRPHGKAGLRNAPSGFRRAFQKPLNLAERASRLGTVDDVYESLMAGNKIHDAARHGAWISALLQGGKTQMMKSQLQAQNGFARYMFVLSNFALNSAATRLMQNPIQMAASLTRLTALGYALQQAGIAPENLLGPTIADLPVIGDQMLALEEQAGMRIFAPQIFQLPLNIKTLQNGMGLLQARFVDGDSTAERRYRRRLIDDLIKSTVPFSGDADRIGMFLRTAETQSDGSVLFTRMNGSPMRLDRDHPITQLMRELDPTGSADPAKLAIAVLNQMIPPLIGEDDEYRISAIRALEDKRMKREQSNIREASRQAASELYRAMTTDSGMEANAQAFARYRDKVRAGLERQIGREPDPAEMKKELVGGAHRFARENLLSMGGYGLLTNDPKNIPSIEKMAEAMVDPKTTGRFDSENEAWLAFLLEYSNGYWFKWGFQRNQRVLTDPDLWKKLGIKVMRERMADSAEARQTRAMFMNAMREKFGTTLR